MNQATSTGTSVTISDIKPGLYSVSATSGETKSVYSPVALFVRVDGTTTEVYANGGTQPIGNTGTANQYEIKMKRSDGITMEQKVKDADAADYTATTTAGVGDTVDFYVKLTIPAYKANAYASIVVNDTLTDLSIDPSSVKVHKDSANGDVIDGAVSYDAVTGKFTLAAGKVSAADTDMTVYLYLQRHRRQGCGHRYRAFLYEQRHRDIQHGDDRNRERFHHRVLLHHHLQLLAEGGQEER